MPRNVLAIFLSSTSEDLRDYRRAITEALGSLHQLSVRMESFGANPNKPFDECRKRVQGCDGLIVVVGHRYGWVPPREDRAGSADGPDGADSPDGVKSITWWEVHWALEAKKPVYAFLADPNGGWTGSREQDRLLDASTEGEALAVWQSVRGLKDFRRFLDTQTTWAYFRGVEDLRATVTSSLVQWVVDHEVQQAKAVVQQEPLPAAPPMTPSLRAAASDFSFTSTKDQTVIVGSDVIVFGKGVTAEQRGDIVNASLLAQLVADRNVPQPKDVSDVLKWYQEYEQVQANIGVTVQVQGFAEYREHGGGVDVSETIVEVAKATLGASPGAVALVMKTLESLKSMDSDSPWITLFNRESRSDKTAKFQVTVVQPDQSEGIRVKSMAFGLVADAKLTQVLSARFQKNRARLVHNSQHVAINGDVLAAVRKELAAKLREHVGTNVAGFDV